MIRTRESLAASEARAQHPCLRPVANAIASEEQLLGFREFGFRGLGFRDCSSISGLKRLQECKPLNPKDLQLHQSSEPQTLSL